jgi:hypothetical protein
MGKLAKARGFRLGLLGAITERERIMDYREFMTKLGEVYTLKKGVIDIYNEAFKGKTEFAEYWTKFTREYTSLATPPMPSFWLKEEVESTTPVAVKDQRQIDYERAQLTKKLLDEKVKQKWGV